jgi:phosphoglycerate kinase
MKYGINTLDDFDFKDKTVICRLDLNSPYDKQNDRLKDITRIQAAIPTIKELSGKGAKLVLMSHQGGDLEYQNFVSTIYHAKVLSELTEKKVDFIDDVCGPFARQAIKNLKPGQILLLDNVRYMAEEMTLFETKLKLSAEDMTKTYAVSKLAPFADIYVCDAFAAAHRDQPTLVAFEYLLPSAMGRLFEKEYEVLSKIMSDPEKPCVFVLGGAKIEDAFDMMPKVLSSGVADKILSSGLLGQIFYMAKKTFLGNKSEEIIYKKKLDEYLPKAKELLFAYPDKIVLPPDFACVKDNARNEFTSGDLPSEHMIADIGSKTISLFKNILSNSGTIFVNGPCGIFEDALTEIGTKELFCYIAGLDAFSVIGGGDSIAAINKYNIAGKFSYVCTGGGAMVRFLTGEELPVVKALKFSANKFK